MLPLVPAQRILGHVALTAHVACTRLVAHAPMNHVVELESLHIFEHFPALFTRHRIHRMILDVLLQIVCSERLAAYVANGTRLVCAPVHDPFGFTGGDKIARFALAAELPLGFPFRVCFIRFPSSWSTSSVFGQFRFLVWIITCHGYIFLFKVVNFTITFSIIQVFMGTRLGSRVVIFIFVNNLILLDLDLQVTNRVGLLHLLFHGL